MINFDVRKDCHENQFPVEKNIDEEPFYSLSNLHHVNDNIRVWTEKAKTAGTDIHLILARIQEIKNNMPSLNRFPVNDWRNGIVLIYQNKMRRYYLCEIIRQVTLHLILKLLDDVTTQYCHKPRLENRGAECFNWLLKRLPKPVGVMHPPVVYEQLFLDMEHQCNYLIHEIDKMREKLHLEET